MRTFHATAPEGLDSQGKKKKVIPIGKFRVIFGVICGAIFRMIFRATLANVHCCVQPPNPRFSANNLRNSQLSCRYRCIDTSILWCLGPMAKAIGKLYDETKWWAVDVVELYIAVLGN